MARGVRSMIPGAVVPATAPFGATTPGQIPGLERGPEPRTVTRAGGRPPHLVPGVLGCVKPFWVSRAVWTGRQDDAAILLRIAASAAGWLIMHMWPASRSMTWQSPPTLVT